METQSEPSLLSVVLSSRFCAFISASACGCDPLVSGFIFTQCVSLVFIQMCFAAHAPVTFSLIRLKLLPFSLSSKYRFDLIYIEMQIKRPNLSLNRETSLSRRLF